MLAANLVAKKRDGHSLSDDEIRFLINGFCDGSVADYQMSALAMAICIRGMTPDETASLTAAMLASGDVLPRSISESTPRVDKHSTGGLGDKISLILAPLLAACDLHVPMISGRGLGLTGGTLDKLEAIEGFRTDLPASEADQVLAECGCFINGATERVAPADRRLYALRDVTATVESVPLITASILSKKLAANLDALVMDVKVGGGAFMKTRPRAQELADSLVRVGVASGLPTSVILSDMDQPLGRAIGNANEVNESIAILSGDAGDDVLVARVRELTIQLCIPLLVQTSRAVDESDAESRLRGALASGQARDRFERMVHLQGGRWQDSLPVAEAVPVLASRDGFIAGIDCHTIGSTIVALGGGRRRMGDPIDSAVGIEMLVQVGDRVQKGQPILSLQCHPRQRTEYLEPLNNVAQITDDATALNELVISRSF